eukprot:COSAG02_NODE_15403_length_1174_cov_1.036279_2_plen_60_part_01
MTLITKHARCSWVGIIIVLERQTVLALQGATRCIAAPAGEYDHDGIATTLPLECGDGSTD